MVSTGRVPRAGPWTGLPLEGLPARNAIVESFETHARNLIEFLTHQHGGRKTTAAGDYTRRQWKLPENTEHLKKLRDGFSQRVAHLSWRRSELSEAERQVATGGDLRRDR